MRDTGTAVNVKNSDGSAMSVPVSASELGRIQRLVDIPSRWTLMSLGIWVFWRVHEAGRVGPWLPILGTYGLIALLSSIFWFSRRPGRVLSFLDAAVAYGLFILDGLFVSALIWMDGGLGSPLYVVLVVLALKAAGLSTVLLSMVWMPFIFGPFYVLALYLANGNLAFLLDRTFLSYYVLLWAWLVGVVLLAWQLNHRAKQVLALEQALVQQQAMLAQKTDVLQRTATDLGNRVLELRALQEVAKTLATALRVEETPRLVVETLHNVTGSGHCAMALLGEDEFSPEQAILEGIVWSSASPGLTVFRLPVAEEPALAEVLQAGRPMRLAACQSDKLRELMGGYPCFITPLVSRGRPIGALFVADHPAVTSSGEPVRELNVTEQLLTSFAYFAATATENARYYQDAWEKRRELEAVLAGIGDGVVVVDPDLALILMNPVARRILGLEIEPPAGVPLARYLDSDASSLRAFVDLLAHTLQTGKEQIRELEFPAASGHGETGREDNARTYGVLASPVLDAGENVSGVVAVLRDVTAQKELERMKSNFLSVVSHELRTPLHSIKGFVEIILMGKTGPVTELQEDFLRTVRTQTTVLQRMIDDLLEFSRMEAGRVKLHLSEVSLSAMAQSVTAKLAPLAEEAGLQLFLDLADDLPEIDGDRMRLEQVLTNLVENAIKFTPAGGKIVVSGERRGDHVLLTVSDTGIGIPPEEQEKVFDRFYQVDGSERRAYRGAGLGLSICRHIVERHNGRIWVESEGISGRGSRFHVELPIQLHVDEPPTIDFSTPAARPKNGVERPG